MEWLVGPLAATGAPVLVELVSVGFYASVGGLLIAGMLAFVVGTSAATLSLPRKLTITSNATAE